MGPTIVSYIIEVPTNVNRVQLSLCSLSTEEDMALYISLVPAHSVIILGFRFLPDPIAEPALYKIMKFLMSALGLLFSSLPCPVCFPHSHCLYSEPLVEHPIQVFQFQWIHHFYELPKLSFNSAHSCSHLKVLPTIPKVSSKAILT